MKNQEGKRITYNDKTRVIGVESGRIPPQAVDVEEMIIGAIMLEGEAIERIDQALTPEMFYKEAHGVIYQACRDMYRSNKAIDLLTVTKELRSREQLEEVGGRLFVTQLTSRVMSSAHIEEHAAIVFEKYLARELIVAGCNAMEAAYSESEDIGDTYARSEMELNRIGELIAGKSEMATMPEIADESIQAAYKRKVDYAWGKTTGISTGLSDLNKLTNGWQPEDLIILAGRPSMGKTAAALHFAKAAAKQTPVVFFSLEMSALRIADRLILSECDVNPDNFGSGNLDENDMSALETAAANVKMLPILLDKNGSINVPYIRAKCKALKKRGQCGVIIVDYLQLIQESSEKGRGREQAVADISKSCKAIAKELGIPFILLSQLSRKCEERSNKEPMLSDLRESGAIEQDADMVIFCFRPAYYYDENTWPKDYRDQNDMPEKNYGELIVAKNRNGKSGVVKFKHNDSITKLFDYNHRNDHYEPTAYGNAPIDYCPDAFYEQKGKPF